MACGSVIAERQDLSQSTASPPAQVLPDTEAEVQEKLDELFIEIEPLARQKNKIDSHASRCRFTAAASALCRCQHPPLGPWMSQRISVPSSTPMVASWTAAQGIGALRTNFLMHLSLASLHGGVRGGDAVRRRTNGLLWAGLALLVLQWGVFLRLTFFELSWDVMEPISYFFSSLWGIMAYAYFMVCSTLRTLGRLFLACTATCTAMTCDTHPPCCFAGHEGGLCLPAQLRQDDQDLPGKP